MLGVFFRKHHTTYSHSYLWTTTSEKGVMLSGSSLTMSTENHYVKTNLEKLHQDSNLKVKELDTVVCEFLVVSVKWSCYIVLSTLFEMSSGIITALPRQKDKYQNMQSLGMTSCILVSYGCVLYVCGFLLACLCKQWWVVSQNVCFCLSGQFHKPLKSEFYGILWV